MWQTERSLYQCCLLATYRIFLRSITVPVQSFTQVPEEVKTPRPSLHEQGLDGVARREIVEILLEF